MIEERALILAVEGPQGELARVRTQRQSACESCQLKAGCGTSSLAKLTGDKSIEMTVPLSLKAKAGDVVILAIPEQGLVWASTLMYLMPLVLMVGLSAASKAWFGVGETGALFAGGLGLFSGFGIAAWYSKKHHDDPRFAPRMTRIALQATPQASCQSR